MLRQLSSTHSTEPLQELYIPPDPTHKHQAPIHQRIYSTDSGPSPISTVATSPDTPVTVSESYFTGGVKDVSEYFIDLDNAVLRPRDYPLDVQAYFECVGRLANGLPNGHMPPSQYEVGPSYIPNDHLMAQGLAMLRQQRNKGLGVWVNPNDVTEKDMEEHPSFPWLGPLFRQHGGDLRPLVRRVEASLQPPVSAPDHVILGNVRLAFPRGVRGPGSNPYWLYVTGIAYGSRHPLDIAAHHPWYNDGHLRASIRSMASGLGCDDISRRPDLPPDPSVDYSEFDSPSDEDDDYESSSSGWSTA